MAVNDLRARQSDKGQLYTASCFEQPDQSFHPSTLVQQLLLQLSLSMSSHFRPASEFPVCCDSVALLRPVEVPRSPEYSDMSGVRISHTQWQV
jgi:hypothetical protein